MPYKPMAEAEKEIDEHMKTALKEIGKIKPWFDEKYNAWVFSHHKYPVEYAGDSKEDVISNYPLYLREFIKYRLKGKLSLVEEKKTKGHGGLRVGAGRRKGTKKEKKRRIYVPKDVADWIQKNPQSIPSVRQLIAAKGRE